MTTSVFLFLLLMNFLKTILLFDSLVLVLKNSFFYLVVTSLVSLCLLKFSIVFQITELFLSRRGFFLFKEMELSSLKIKKILIFSQKKFSCILGNRALLYFHKKNFFPIFWEMELFTPSFSFFLKGDLKWFFNDL